MKLLLLSGALALAPALHAQHHLLLLKKNERTVRTYWEGSDIAFQLNNGAWQKGELVALRNDSIFLRTRIVRYYSIGTDTLVLPLQGYALGTISAFPKKGVEVDYSHGAFGISNRGRALGATLLQVGAVGYTALSLINGLREGNYSVKEHGTELAIAGAAYATGFAIKRLQRFTYRLGSKYHLDIISLDGPK